MATRTYGQLSEFHPESESITSYVERARLFFRANDIVEEKQSAVFLSVIGGKTYALLRNLVAPDLPQNKTLPKPEDLFAMLAGGQNFSKLDLLQAYQQLLLEESSKKYTTINTHKGLYQYSRLPFGIASAPAIFQKTMDAILQGIPHMICYIDDILVTGANDEEHLQNLGEVLQRLEQHSLRTKKPKCEFLKPSVECLGHHIDAQGLHTMSCKLDAIVQAPKPENLQQLRSFLGLLNYYGRPKPGHHCAPAQQASAA